MIGTDSHTPNAGGLGMVAIGVGGADAVDVMTGFPFNVRWPKVIGVKLTGTLSGWSSPKDVILEVARVLTVEGGTGAIVEYFGSAQTPSPRLARRPSATWAPRSGPPAACLGMTPTWRVSQGHGSRRNRRSCRLVAAELRPDDGALYDQVIEVDLDQLKPLINGPHSPDRANRVGAAVGAEAGANGWPLEISAALIGSCTNSSYEDITRAASVARQAAAMGLRTKTPLLISPGSEQIRATIERDGLLGDLEAIGATVLANAVRAVYWPVGSAGRSKRGAEHHCQQFQSQLPQAQRWVGEHPLVRDISRHRDRACASGPTRLRPNDRHNHQPGWGRGPPGTLQLARYSRSSATTPA